MAGLDLVIQKLGYGFGIVHLEILQAGGFFDLCPVGCAEFCAGFVVPFRYRDPFLRHSLRIIQAKSLAAMQGTQEVNVAGHVGNDHRQASRHGLQQGNRNAIAASGRCVK